MPFDILDYIAHFWPSLLLHHSVFWFHLEASDDFAIRKCNRMRLVFLCIDFTLSILESFESRILDFSFVQIEHLYGLCIQKHRANLICFLLFEWNQFFVENEELIAGAIDYILEWFHDRLHRRRYLVCLVDVQDHFEELFHLRMVKFVHPMIRTLTPFLRLIAVFESSL